MARVGPQRHRKNAGKLIHALTKLTGLMGCYGVCFGVYAGLPAFRSNLLTCVQGRRIRRWGERNIQDGFLRRSGRISASLIKHPYPEGAGRTFKRNIGICVSSYTLSYPS